MVLLLIMDTIKPRPSANRFFMLFITGQTYALIPRSCLILKCSASLHRGLGVQAYVCIHLCVEKKGEGNSVHVYPSL